MQDWRIDRDKVLEASELGIDCAKSDQVLVREAVSLKGLTTSIFEEDERQMSSWAQKRTSVGWTLPPPEPANQFIQRKSANLGIDDQEELGLLGQISERDRGLLDKACCSEDVIRVWNNISVFIIRKLKEGTGVQIPGLYTITFQTEKTIMPLDTQYYVLKKIPVMILSRFLIETYCLRNRTEDEFVFRAPSVPLNLTEIATMSKLSRIIVDGAITEVLHGFARALICNKKLEFPLPNIGKLQVEERLGVMKFYQEFYTNMDYHMESSSVAIPFRQRRRSSAFSREVEIPPLLPQQPDLDFDIIPGQMTPLRRHIPTETYRSVFHLGEVRSIHEDDHLAPVELKERAKVYGKFPKSVLPQSYPVDLLERIIYLTQEDDPELQLPEPQGVEFGPTPIMSEIQMEVECAKGDGGRYVRLRYPDGTLLEPKYAASVWEALDKTGLVEQCLMPSNTCVAKNLDYACLTKPRLVRATVAPIPKPKEDMTWPGIKHTGLTPIMSLQTMMLAGDNEEFEGETEENEDEDEEEEEETEEIPLKFSNILVGTQKTLDLSVKFNSEPEKLDVCTGKPIVETEKSPIEAQLEPEPEEEIPDDQSLKLYLIMELNNEETVFLLEEIPTCASVLKSVPKPVAKTKSEMDAAIEVAAAKEARRRSVHDPDCKPGFAPTQLYTVKPTGKFTIDLLLGNRSMYLDFLFNHHHRMCMDVLGLEEVMKHFDRRGTGSLKPLSYDD